MARATSRTVDGACPAIALATARSTFTTCSLSSERERTATLRATQGSQSPASTTAHVRGSRWTRSSPSAMSARVVAGWVSRAMASSGIACSRTSGVPSPPGVTIGSWSSRGCPLRTAHWIARRSSSTSASRRARRASVAIASTCVADASSAAGGDWGSEGAIDMPAGGDWGSEGAIDMLDSIEHMFDTARVHLGYEDEQSRRNAASGSPCVFAT
ncbi:hypothetical protein NOCA1230005 [metagenome]|uniref:Uncharacterized protein n=1 Tax=metagenome TaxID=256318 RepID=A0A2P2CFM0_9ZZZZ